MKKALTRLAVWIAAVLVSAEPALPLLASLLPPPETCGMACCRRARTCCCRQTKAHAGQGRPGWQASLACAPGCGRAIATAPLPPVIIAPPGAGIAVVLTGFVLDAPATERAAASAAPFALFQRPPPRA